MFLLSACQLAYSESQIFDYLFELHLVMFVAMHCGVELICQAFLPFMKVFAKLSGQLHVQILF